MSAIPFDLASLAVLVVSLTQWIKDRLGLQNTAAEVVSFVVGFAFGAAYWGINHPPAALPDWFGVVLAGIGMALVPSGMYKFVVQIRDGKSSAK